MSGSGQRQAVFPTRMALTTLKQREVGAKKGYELLKKKSDALMLKLRGILHDIKNTKLAVAKEMQGATFCISEAMWAAGDFRKHVVEAPQRERALVTVRVRQDNVAGVKLPIFTLQKATGTTLEMETLGLAGGGRQIGKAKDKFTSLLELLVKLGSLQTSFITLDEALKVTNRRVNALDNVVIPSFTATIAYVTSELDEIEKEEFFRLKKVLKVKIRNAELEEEEKLAQAVAERAAAAGGGGSSISSSSSSSSGSSSTSSSSREEGSRAAAVGGAGAQPSALAASSRKAAAAAGAAAGAQGSSGGAGAAPAAGASTTSVWKAAAAAAVASAALSSASSAAAHSAAAPAEAAAPAPAAEPAAEPAAAAAAAAAAPAAADPFDGSPKGAGGGGGSDPFSEFE